MVCVDCVGWCNVASVWIRVCVGGFWGGFLRGVCFWWFCFVCAGVCGYCLICLLLSLVL